MNMENPSVEQHEAPEKFPSQEEIRHAFETVAGSKNYKELRLRSDHEGVHMYEVEITLENGERWEYNYQRATYDYKAAGLPAASIHVTTYDADGIPYGGQCVANYLNGTWKHVQPVF